MKNIIHLYTINECGKKCPMCCNKLYDIEALPVVTVAELKSANTVCLTGGDPFLYNELYKFIGRLRGQYPNIKKIYMLIRQDMPYTIISISIGLRLVNLMGYP